MQDQETTKEQLINELESLRRRVTELEESEAGFMATEQLLRESEERFRLLYENAPLAYNPWMKTAISWKSTKLGWIPSVILAARL